MDPDKNTIPVRGETKPLFVVTIIARLITHPIHTILTNYQNTSGLNIKECIRTIWSRGGIRGFYSGLLASLLSRTTKHVITTNLLQGEYNMPFWIGCHLIADLIRHPFDVITIHRQMNSPFWELFVSQGIPLLYRGLSKTFMSSIVASSTFVSSFGYLDKKVNPSINFVISAILSNILMHPFHYMAVRQIYFSPKETTLDALRWNKSWFLGWNPYLYYRGLSLNLAIMIPYTIMIGTFISYARK